MRAAGRRTRYWWMAAGALVVVFATAVYLGLFLPTTGPLGSTTGGGVRGSANAGDTVALLFLVGDTTGAVELSEVKLLGAHPALEIVRTNVIPCRPPKLSCAPLAIQPWPPSNDRLAAVPGYRLEPGGNTSIAFAVRAPSRPHRLTYLIDGAILEYRQGLRRFRTKLGPAMRLRVPAAGVR